MTDFKRTRSAIDRLVKPEAAERRWRQALNAYHGRPYHSLVHIERMLSLADVHANLIKDKAVVDLAIVYHDLVCSPTNKPPLNEQMSAHAVYSDVAPDLVDPRWALPAAAIIEKTAKHLEVLHDLDGDTAFVLDIDLAGFTLPWDACFALEQQIRLEYNHVDDDAYHVGKRAFLQALLDRNVLYYTPLYQEKEHIARANLERMLKHYS